MARSKRSTQKKIKGGNEVPVTPAEPEPVQPVIEEEKKGVVDTIKDWFAGFSTSSSTPAASTTTGGKAKKSKGTKKTRK